MPLQQSFTDAAGRDYAASYWRLDEVSASRASQRAAFVFTGWASNAARVAGRDPIGTRSVFVTGAAFLAIFGPAATVNVFSAAETAALADPQFAGATQV